MALSTAQHEYIEDGRKGLLTSEDDVAGLLPSHGSSSDCTSTVPSAFCTRTSPSTSLPAIQHSHVNPANTGMCPGSAALDADLGAQRSTHSNCPTKGH